MICMDTDSLSSAQRPDRRTLVHEKVDGCNEGDQAEEDKMPVRHGFDPIENVAFDRGMFLIDSHLMHFEFRELAWHDHIIPKMMPEMNAHLLSDEAWIHFLFF